MAITNLLLPTLIAGLNSGNFGKMESRPSHYGAVNVAYNNAPELFGQDLIDKIRAQPAGREIKIPIFDKQDWAVVTSRSCTINCADISSRLQTLTRTHLAVDICINENDYDVSYVGVDQALKQRYEMAMKAIYKTLDLMVAAFFESNKDTSMTPDVGGATPNVNPLMKQKAGAYEVPNSLYFYSYLTAIMDQMDIQGPFLDLMNTVANADINIMNNPGGGAILNTQSLLNGANIAAAYSDYSNRVAAGTLLPVHYVAPVGSVGLLNMIDLDYQRSGVIGSDQTMGLWDKFGDMENFMIRSQMPDPIYNKWDWGVLEAVDCVSEQKVYKVKFSADFTLARDFTSVTGESPIKRFDIAALRTLTT